MYNLSVKNHIGEMLELTGTEDYTIIRVEGLNPPPANVITANNASYDGSMLKMSRLADRNIVISLIPNAPIEQNRIKLYRYFKTKKEVTLYLSNGTRNVYITGTVDTFEINMFDKKQLAQISILCTDPCFKDVNTNEVNFYGNEPNIEFDDFEIPIGGIELSIVSQEGGKSVFNQGDLDVGMVIEMEVASGYVLNPIIINNNTGEFLKINARVSSWQNIIIDTRQKHKSIKLVTGGAYANMLASRDPASTWVTFEAGNNNYLVSADENPENLRVKILYNPLYEGV